MIDGVESSTEIKKHKDGDVLLVEIQKNIIIHDFHDLKFKRISSFMTFRSAVQLGDFFVKQTAHPGISYC